MSLYAQQDKNIRHPRASICKVLNAPNVVIEFSCVILLII